MILILLPAVWLAALLFGFIMLRLAALSDHSQAVALSEWLAASRRADPPSERIEDPLPLAYETPRVYRATG